jgi:mRNA interferase MazF
VKRGDLVTVTTGGDYGKPSPALVVQTDYLIETDSVLVCLITSTIRDTQFHRLSLPAGGNTGLVQPSQVMIDKIMAVPRNKCRGPIGCVDSGGMLELNRRLAFVLGFSG